MGFVCALFLPLHIVVPAVLSHLHDVERLVVFICFNIPAGVCLFNSA